MCPFPAAPASHGSSLEPDLFTLLPRGFQGQLGRFTQSPEFLFFGS